MLLTDKIMEFEKYYKSVLKETEGLLFATQTYIKLLWEEGVSIERAINAIKYDNE